MWNRLRAKAFPFFLGTITVLLWSGCSDIPGGGGGGLSSEPRFIEGTFESIPESGQASQDYVVKTIVFTKDGKFTAYRTAQSLNENTPDINGTYEIVDKDIVFKNPEGSEFETRGTMINESDTRFSWPLFQGDVFVKKSAD